MASNIFNLLILLISISSIVTNILPRLSNDTTLLPKVKINLDLPVKERYRDIFIQNKMKVKAYVDWRLQMSYGLILSKFGKYLLNNSKQNPEWIEYIKALSEYCEIPLSSAVMLSVSYEVSCTTTIIQDSNDNIFMGRNLDFDGYYIIDHLMMDIEYYKNGKLLYKGIELIGTSGVLNAAKPGKFAISMNQRYSHHTAIGNLYRAYNGYATPAFNAQRIMEQADSYEEAFELLSKCKLTAPIFFTVTGVNKNEGAIISRDVNSIYRVDTLDVDNGKWFLVITNTDIDKIESEEDYRRIPAEENLKVVGRENINYENLMNNIMSVYPTNNILTIYTTIQSPSGYFNSTLWLP